MTKDQERRILQAIAECDRFLAKEKPRAADLRPADITELLAFYESHKLKLIDILAQEGAA